MRMVQKKVIPSSIETTFLSCHSPIMNCSLSFAVLRKPFKVSLVDRGRVGCELGNKALSRLIALTFTYQEHNICNSCLASCQLIEFI